MVLFPGARELVDWLCPRDYLLALATGKSRRGLDRALGDTGLADRFHATRCADETCSEPHPEMLLQIMDELGVTGAETLMVGDTESICRWRAMPVAALWRFVMGSTNGAISCARALGLSGDAP